MMSWMGLCGLLAGCAQATADGETWLPVTRGDLVLEVDVTGTLKALRSAPIGPPPAAIDHGEPKIARMAPEGSEVKKGTKVLHFDVGELERELRERIADRDSAAREVDRKRHDIELSKRDGELRVVEAEAALRKARLKADLPPQYTAAVEVKLAKIDLDAAEAELRMARQRLEHTVRLGEAELQYLRDRHSRFQSRAERLQNAIGQMAVTTPVDGVVVYRTSWRGEKKKVGDPCWVFEPCLEIVDVKEMEAIGEVDELESARVAVGQTVRLRLEALPEAEWTGKVVSLRPNVYRQSPRTPLKVIGVKVQLEKTDAARMRPGMQFRGRLETGRVDGVVLAPIEAVHARPEGPVAFVKTTTGWTKVQLQLGKRSRTHVEVKAGLTEGDRISRRDLEGSAS